MRRILFSAIGGTDPITNQHDGAMLHICRVYQPEEVYLYLSKEMHDFQEKDERYTKVLELLAEKTGTQCKVHLISNENMKEVHVFDAFIGEFERIIQQIFQEQGTDIELLMNVSSGTPAMKSSLQLLSFMYGKTKAIQVSSPAKAINKIHEDRDHYDLQLQWELDVDNNNKFENRCVESTAKYLSDRLKKESIVEFIEKYDYTAAETLMKTLAEEPSKEFRSMLRVAQKRIILDLRNMRKEMNILPKELFPVQEGNKMAEFEYLLTLDIKVQKGEYADALRGITPLTTELMEKVMLAACPKIKIEDFATAKKNGVFFLDKNKINNQPELKNIFQNQFGGKTITQTAVSSIHFKGIIDYYSSDDELKALVSDIRKVESSIRNLAAHQIVSITEEFVKTKTGFTMGQIIEKLKRLMRYSGIYIKEDAWNAYDTMNKRLKELLECV